MTEDKRMTQSEIYTLAVENNYSTLYNCINMYYYKGESKVSWEQAMEIAAITLSKQNAELQAELLHIHETSVIRIIEGKLIHMSNAPGCTDKKRGATYYNNHHIQINKHGKLIPELERSPPKNLRK